MTRLSNLMAFGKIAHHRPWPRAAVTQDQWREALRELGDGRWGLLGLWGEPRTAHMAVLDGEAAEIGVLSLDCPERTFPSVGQGHAPAIRLERALYDLVGLRPIDAPDLRPWLDHGRWSCRHPLGHNETAAHPDPYTFLPAEGPGIHQIPVGPVHAGIIEPGHFRFHASGETVVRLEERLGYVHKGVEGLMRGADLQHAAKLAGRVSGDSTVAYALAFARATEAALDIEAPPRSQWLRALMAELERLANHFGDIGAICNDASFSLMHAHCGVLRERVLKTAASCFGHRMMRDCVRPGGAAVDLGSDGDEAIRALLHYIKRRFPSLVALYDGTNTLQDRTVGTGVLKAELAQQYAAGGFVGRASGRSFDARRTIGYPPYSELQFDIPTLTAGDVDARVWIRIREVESSLCLIDQILERMPSGLISIDIPHRAGEGMALVEGFRGDVLVWLRADESGHIDRCHLRDPSWFQWPLLEAAIEGNIVADFPLCNKSFNCSYSGHDL
jgi:Ni,Fe-hydrogenase III large subunit